MIRRPPRSTPLYSSAASDVYKRQSLEGPGNRAAFLGFLCRLHEPHLFDSGNLSVHPERGGGHGWRPVDLVQGYDGFHLQHLGSVTHLVELMGEGHGKATCVRGGNELFRAGLALRALGSRGPCHLKIGEGAAAPARYLTGSTTKVPFPYNLSASFCHSHLRASCDRELFLTGWRTNVPSSYSWKVRRNSSWVFIWWPFRP